MIFGIGMDLCEIRRMEKSLQSESFFARVFGPQEQEQLMTLGHGRRAQSAAANFAAKESFLKALGLGLGSFSFADIQTIRLPGGAPQLKLSGKAAEFMSRNNLTAFVTLTHEAGIAGATVVIEKNA